MLSDAHHKQSMVTVSCSHLRQLLLQLHLIKQYTPANPQECLEKELCRDLDGDVSTCDVYKVLSPPLSALFNWNTHFNKQLINTVSRENHVLKWSACGSLRILLTHLGQPHTLHTLSAFVLNDRDHDKEYIQINLHVFIKMNTPWDLCLKNIIPINMMTH